MAIMANFIIIMKLQVFFSFNDTTTTSVEQIRSTVENGPRKIAPNEASIIGNCNTYLTY